MKYVSETGEFLEIVEITPSNHHKITACADDEFALLWFLSDHNELSVDTVDYTFNSNQIIGSNGLHRINPGKINRAKLLIFNRPFLFTLNMDRDIKYQGIFFYGSDYLPVLRLNKNNVGIISTAWDMLRNEIESNKQVQPEVLQMIFQRILFFCHQIYKEQHTPPELSAIQSELFQSFHVLVDLHFREKHSVAEYASILNKSPKTLSNTFRKASRKSPLEYIQDRLHLEARRLLRYTDKPVNQISSELGFNDLHSFSRFYKKKEGLSPSYFRQSATKGKIAK